MNRREFAVGAAAAALWRPQDDPYGGFKMGVQTYSLREFDLDGALARVKELGLKYAEFYPGPQMPLTGDVETVRKKLADAGIQMLSYGVVKPTRKAFEFARAMGFRVIVADPDPDSFEGLDALTQEFEMKIAIHNHGPGHRYGKLADVQKAVEKWPEAIGACVDTGHFIRSGEDPAAVIRALGARVHDVHLKDARDADTFTLLGEGKLDVGATLRALREIKFGGLVALEYELNEKDPVGDMKKCLEVVRSAVKRL
jgi:sugar phosphate isomerase/epimerase